MEIVMNEHFIKNIEIKKFKCFENFKAEGFSRVNLITGENNVGKTAFMEACFLLSNIHEVVTIFKKENPNHLFDSYIPLIRLLLILQQNRESEKFNLAWIKEELQLHFDDFEIKTAERDILKVKDRVLQHRYLGEEKMSSYITESSNDVEGLLVCNHSINGFRGNPPPPPNAPIHTYTEFDPVKTQYDTWYIKNTLPNFENHTFISNNSSVCYLGNLIDELKLNNQLGKLNTWLKKMFGINTVDVIRGEVMLKKNKGNFMRFSDFGDGTKQFILALSSLLINENKVIYLDEIDNGIHHSKLDELWEVILRTSKKLNVQVFATTHSKECIESYARVAKKLEDEAVTLIRLAKLKSGEINAGIFDSSVLESAISQDHEVRG